jgi:predicted transcriptional regulator
MLRFGFEPAIGDHEGQLTCSNQSQMNEHNHKPGPDMVGVAAELVSAYVSNNSVPAGDLPQLITSTYAAICGLQTGSIPGASAADVEIEKPSAAQIRKSVRDDGIVSFLDGKAYKTLKRHLSVHGLDPRSYRERFGLPSDYPMVAPSYAATRSALAKAIGLGRPGGMASQVEEEVQPVRKGRRKAA